MRFQIKPERWMCLPTAFAMVVNKPIGRVLLDLGHDGSEIISTNPEPSCRRGFHIQEIIRLAIRYHYSMTPIEVAYQLEKWPKEIVDWDYFNQTINKSQGIIEGQGPRCGHAVAYDYGMILDPDGPFYKYSNDECVRHGLICIQCAWRIQNEV